jgi:hypothetical protein
MPNSEKPLTPLEQLRNVCDALAQGELEDNTPLTKAERAEAKDLRTKLMQFAENYTARLETEGKAGSSQWTKRAERSDDIKER